MATLADLVDDLRAAIHQDLNGNSGSPMSGSKRAIEISELRSTDGGGGVARAGLLNELATDATLMSVMVPHYLLGLHDLLHGAMNRDQSISRPALSAVVRPIIEVCSVIFWLVDPVEPPAERARRFTRWVFDDFSSYARFAGAMFGDDEEDGRDELLRALTSDAGAFAVRAESARFAVAEPDANGGRQLKKLDRPDKRDPPPSQTELANHLLGTKSVYAQLSAGTHGLRYGVVIGASQAARLVRRTTSGQTVHQVAVTGTGVSLKNSLLAIGVSIRKSIAELVEWDGRSAARTRRMLAHLQESAMAIDETRAP
jgi:hypothetical protein